MRQLPFEPQAGSGQFAKTVVNQLRIARTLMFEGLVGARSGPCDLTRSSRTSRTIAALRGVVFSERPARRGFWRLDRALIVVLLRRSTLPRWVQTPLVRRDHDPRGRSRARMRSAVPRFRAGSRCCLGTCSRRWGCYSPSRLGRTRRYSSSRRRRKRPEARRHSLRRTSSRSYRHARARPSD